MDVHDLPIDQAQRFQFLAPIEKLRECQVNQRKDNQAYTDYFIVQFHFFEE